MFNLYPIDACVNMNYKCSVFKSYKL